MRKIANACCSVIATAALLAGCGSSGPRTVAPKDGPYRYAVPSGFVVVKASFPGTDPPFLTTAIPAHRPPHSGGLNAFEVPITARGVSPASVLPAFDRKEQAFYRDMGAAITPGAHRRVGGHDAICWSIAHFHNAYDGLVDADSCAIAGRRLILQTCTWKPASRAVVQRGCRALRARLRVY